MDSEDSDFYGMYSELHLHISSSYSSAPMGETASPNKEASDWLT